MVIHSSDPSGRLIASQMRKLSTSVIDTLERDKNEGGNEYGMVTQQDMSNHDGSSTSPFLKNGKAGLDMAKAIKYKPSRESETIRLIMQYLNDHGYKAVARKLESESSIIMEPVVVKTLRLAIMEDKWSEVERLLFDLELGKPEIKKIRHYIKQEKYIKALLKLDYAEAVKLLRSEIAEPKEASPYIIETLSSFLLYTPIELPSRLAFHNIEYGREKLLGKIQSYIPSHMMLPPSRLESLVDQAIKYQKLKCFYHVKNDYDLTGDDDNSASPLAAGRGSNVISLLKDHTCGKSQLHYVCKWTCAQHADEVWYVAFSPNGKFLASASKDKSIIVWNTDKWASAWVLSEHKGSVAFLAWSHDSKLLSSCSNDARIIIWNIETGKSLYTFTKHTQCPTSCVWYANSTEIIVSGGLDQLLVIWKVKTGEIIYKWTGYRITDLAIHPKGTFLYAVCHERKIRKFDLRTYQEISCLNMLDTITSLSVSRNGSVVLVSLSSQEIQIWDMDKKSILQKFHGHKQTKYIVRSAFAGGLDENFIISGSEGTMASASDDGTIK